MGATKAEPVLDEIGEVEVDERGMLMGATKAEPVLEALIVKRKLFFLKKID